jgi:hypothetical protein
MATFASLTPAQQAQVQNYVDQVLRPTVLGLARALARANTVVVPQYLSSPTGAASTIAAPAGDSVAGLVASLDANQVVPVLSSGYPLSGPLLGSKVAAYTAAFNTLLGTHFSAAVQQDYAQIVGAPNLIT